MDPLPSDSSHQEEDRQESVERVGLFHPGRADQGLHGREPESQEGERRPLLRQGHDAQVSHVDYLRGLILVLQGPRTCLPGERAALEEVGGRQLVSVKFPAMVKWNEVFCLQGLLPLSHNSSASILLCRAYVTLLLRITSTIFGDFISRKESLLEHFISGHIWVCARPGGRLPKAIRVPSAQWATWCLGESYDRSHECSE